MNCCMENIFHSIENYIGFWHDIRLTNNDSIFFSFIWKCIFLKRVGESFHHWRQKKRFLERSIWSKCYWLYIKGHLPAQSAISHSSVTSVACSLIKLIQRVCISQSWTRNVFFLSLVVGYLSNMSSKG